MLIVVSIPLCDREADCKGRKPQITKISQMGFGPDLDRSIQMLAMVRGTSVQEQRSMGTGIGVSQELQQFYILSGDSGNELPAL